MQSLSLRLTHIYVGTYRHLDKWLEIGTFDELGRRELPLPAEDEDDPCEPRKHELFVFVKPSPELHELWLQHKPAASELDAFRFGERKIAQALRDMHTSHGCAHDWDCCGCRSYSAEAERFSGDVWRVVVSSSRNF